MIEIKRMMFNKKSNSVLDLNFNSIKYLEKKSNYFHFHQCHHHPQLHQIPPQHIEQQQ